jgi:hypothetical protein
MKSTLKNKRYHTSKHTFSITQNKVDNFLHFSDLGLVSILIEIYT